MTKQKDMGATDSRSTPEDRPCAPQQSTAQAPRPGFQAVVPMTFVAIAIAWTAAWIFELDAVAVLGMSAAVLVLASLVAGFRMFLGSTTPSPTPPKAGAVGVTRPDGPSRFFAASQSARERGVPLNGRRWSLDVFAAIDSQRFAAVCETWFSWAGFDTRSEAHRTDEGVDIWLHAARLPGPVAIVRCKHWLNKPVGLQDMKDFFSVVVKFQSAHGTFTTTSTYTPEALQFAREHGIDAVDGPGLLRRIQMRTRQRQQALLAVAYNSQQ